jgi:formylglycine-generating enzyme required for sulfatase activity
MNSTAFCYIPPGPGWLGSPADDDLTGDNESPLHRLALAYGYWLARFPVTVAHFNTIMDGKAFFFTAPSRCRPTPSPPAASPGAINPTPAGLIITKPELAAPARWAVSPVGPAPTAVRS